MIVECKDIVIYHKKNVFLLGKVIFLTLAGFKTLKSGPTRCVRVSTSLAYSVNTDYAFLFVEYPCNGA